MFCSFYSIKISFTIAGPKNVAVLKVSVNKYRIVGILCEVLICANYASCRGLADLNSVRLLSTSCFNPVIDLHVPQFHTCDY